MMIACIELKSRFETAMRMRRIMKIEIFKRKEKERNRGANEPKNLYRQFYSHTNEKCWTSVCEQLHTLSIDYYVYNCTFFRHNSAHTSTDCRFGILFISAIINLISFSRFFSLSFRCCWFCVVYFDSLCIISPLSAASVLNNASSPLRFSIKHINNEREAYFFQWKM